MGTDKTVYNFLQGGGEMGKLIRARDWSETPLGDPQTWPQPLRTMVSVMLDNPFGMYIAWGKEYTQIYNDGYRPILGANKHPEALGISTKDTFSEIWHIIGSMFDGVMNGVAVGFPDFMLPLDRNGYIETCYFDFAYSPIRMQNGEVGGVLVTVIETTNKKKAQDELQASKVELEFVIESAQFGTYDYNPITNRFSGNNRLKNWFGLPPEDEIELTHAMNVIAENDRERVSEAIQKVLEYSSGGIYDVEYSIINPILNKEIIVHAKGRAWFNEDKIAYRLNGTIEDITEQTIANRKTKETAQHIRTMVLESPVGICVLDAGTLISEIVNDSFIEIAGKPREAIVGKFFGDAFAEARPYYEGALEGVIASGEAFYANEVEMMMVRHGREEIIYVTFVYAPLKDENDKVVKVAVWLLDNTQQVEARKEIMVSENNLRLMILQAPVAIAIFRGTDYRVEIANKFALEIWGRTEEQVLNIPLFEAIPELLSQGIKEFLDDVAKTGNRFATLEMPVQIIINEVLETAYINFSFEALYDVEGNINGIMAIGVDVTPQVEVRRKVEESEIRYNLMLMQSPFAFLILKGEDMVVQLANDSMIEVLGKGPDIEGKPLLEVLPELKGQAFPGLLDGVYNTGIPFSANEMLAKLMRNGELEDVYFNYVYQPYYEADKTISGVTVIAYDVSSVVIANKKIEESEEKLKLIIDASDLGVWDLDLNTQDMVASDRCYEILGFPNTKNLTPEKLIAHVHPDDLNLRTEAFEKAYEVGSLHYQIRIIWDDQSLHWKDVKGKVFYDRNNEPERMLGTVRDITEERNFHEQLLEREEKFRLLADSMPQHIWTADPEGNLNYFNQSVFDYSGLTLKKINKDGWIQIVHPDDREENIKQWKHAIGTGQDFLFEHRFRKHNGEYRWQLSRAIPQKDAEGVIKMWVGTSTDIQEQKMFANELEKMVQQRTNELRQKNMDLEKMNKELQSFVYISSHDLQEPLRKIQTFASRIRETEYDTLSEKAKSHFSRMQKSAHRMQNLIQDLISYSRTNVQEVKFEVVDLHEIIEDVKETLSEELEQNDVIFKLSNLGKVTVIPVQFTQVILNLVSNAIKFSKSDDTVIIGIECDTVDGKNCDIEALPDDQQYCHIRFSDNGIGFEKQYNEKIFEVFQRLHSRDEYTGTGIGLAIVKRIIENHDGVILAQGVPSKGATFDIYIPAH